MVLLTRFDYSRLREFKLRIYAPADRARSCSCSALGTAARGLAPLDRPAVLPVPAVRAGQAAADRGAVGVRRRPLARLGERETTARLMLLALGPAALVMLQPDLGSALVYVALAMAILFVAGTPGRQLGGLVALFARGDRARARRRPGGRRARAQALPGGAPDGLREPLRRPERRDLPDQPVADRDRLRREDRPGRRPRDADGAELPPRAPHGLHLHRGGGDVRLRRAPRSCCRSTRC